jgi:hypothetical protein
MRRPIYVINRHLLVCATAAEILAASGFDVLVFDDESYECNGLQASLDNQYKTQEIKKDNHAYWRRFEHKGRKYGRAK